MMETAKSISSFEALFLELQEYCNRLEGFNGLKQDLKLQDKFDGEKWEIPWVYKGDEDSFEVLCYGVVMKCLAYWGSFCSGKKIYLSEKIRQQYQLHGVDGAFLFAVNFVI